MFIFLECDNVYQDPHHHGDTQTLYTPSHPSIILTVLTPYTIPPTQSHISHRDFPKFQTLPQSTKHRSLPTHLTTARASDRPACAPAPLTSQHQGNPARQSRIRRHSSPQPAPVAQPLYRSRVSRPWAAPGRRINCGAAAVEVVRGCAAS